MPLERCPKGANTSTFLGAKLAILMVFSEVGMKVELSGGRVFIGWEAER